ncbi:mechanosensitive ion channel family protein [Microbacterium sp. YY-01]|uniref:mechanosensitive ion channel family protein n=1 Tax=Microbacterium sp. YY-01 TaxID=3421634 RepID=UPI003D1816F3
MMGLPLEDGDTTAEDLSGLWQTILQFFIEAGSNLLQIAIVIAICVGVAFLLRIIIRRVVRRIVNNAKQRAKVADTIALERSPLAEMRLVQRTRTLGTILQNIVNVGLLIVALALIVNILNEGLLGSLTLITAAVGAGLGFGAQNIVKDVLNGMFIVAEDQIGIGDVVDLGLASGVVEYVSVRITQVRDANGTLWYVRNGEVLRIGNMSQGWARVITDVGVAPDAPLHEVEEAMLHAATSIAHDPRWRTRIVDMPELWGLESIDGETINVRIVIKTRANARDDVAQELRLRLKNEIEQLGLDAPRLTAVFPTGPEGSRRVRGANPPRTLPTPVAGVAVPERGVWRKRKSSQSPREETEE